MLKVKYTVFRWKLNEDLPLSYGRKLRGFFANKFEDVLFHHHKKNGQYRYAYPLIQYKIAEGEPVTIGLKRGAELLLRSFLEVDKLKLGDTKYDDLKRELTIKDKQISIEDDLIYEYKFLTPWLGLNQQNYKCYVDKIQDQTFYQRQDFLSQILIGNILAFAKGIDWWIEDEVKVISKLEEKEVKFKDQLMVGFEGKIKTNVCLPDYIGLGKATARGFGALKKNS